MLGDARVYTIDALAFASKQNQCAYVCNCNQFWCLGSQIQQTTVRNFLGTISPLGVYPLFSIASDMKLQHELYKQYAAKNMHRLLSILDEEDKA